MPNRRLVREHSGGKGDRLRRVDREKWERGWRLLERSKRLREARKDGEG